MATTSETCEFKAEIAQLMHLIVNTFYSNKEIFLRELISNSSDALDKIRHLCLTNEELRNVESQFKILIFVDKTNGVLNIVDSGIGMTRQDLKDNLGTIAHSGTKHFASLMENAKAAAGDSSLKMIGQFGVGFYSAFLVADRVQVITKNVGDCYLSWTSDTTSYTITEVKEREEHSQSVFSCLNLDPSYVMPFKRGTWIRLFLKKECLDYLQTDEVMKIITKHSRFINYPIEMLTEKMESARERKRRRRTTR